MEHIVKAREKVSGEMEKLNRFLRRNAAEQTDTAKLAKKKSTKKTIREMIVSWLFLTPSLLGVLIFFVLPFCVVVFYSVVNNPIQKQFVGISNFIRVFNNNAFRLAALNTAKFSIIAVPLAVILSLFLAVVMESGIPFKSQFRSFFLI